MKIMQISDAGKRAKPRLNRNSVNTFWNSVEAQMDCRFEQAQKPTRQLTALTRSANDRIDDRSSL